ncbi:MAG: cytochrome-c peroxidase [Chloroflexi bacterium]|nr:cytochrome-c peroxidase [Chloroflexota bacterium]
MNFRNFMLISVTLLAADLFLAGCGPTETFDDRLQAVVTAQGIRPYEPPPSPEPALVALGEALYFDKILSGNRDISCATCHHPALASGDELALSIGTGGMGLGTRRQMGVGRERIPRNAPEVFNRGAAEWRTMFWDSRVMLDEEGEFITPAGNRLPDGLQNVLAAQAMFPVTSRDEMRGNRGDVDVWGQPNELAAMADTNILAIWDGLMKRLLAVPEYVTLFQAAYPDTPLEELDFTHAANAIAAYEAEAFSLYQNPWYAYLNGDRSAMSDEAKRGAVLFFGDAGCAACHSGPLFTDQQAHVIAAPQIGPGKGIAAPYDYGRFWETGDPRDKYAFRTPPLLNVAATGPWLHDGAYSTLEAVIRHHLDPDTALRSYDPAEHLPPDLQDSFQTNLAVIEEMLGNVDPLLAPSRQLSPQEIEALGAFLEALTDTAVTNLANITPTAVPSGLPVTDN